jgi:fatty acyl-CoA reductase
MSKLIPVLEAQTIFLTGATGFLGKVLLHKLLNTCRNIRVVYVLIRGKKGLSAVDRLDRELLSLPVFDELFTSHPHLKERIKVVDGDISKPYLGLSSSDRQTLEQNVTLILHCAATTKFMENLRVLTTTKRTISLSLSLSHTIIPNNKNIKTFLHRFCLCSCH